MTCDARLTGTYRKLIRLGAPEGVAQQAVGWDDPDTARRYDIVAQRIWMYCANDTMRPERTMLSEPETEPVCTKNGQKACKLLWPRSSEG